jgi:hypothetical protein
MRIIRGKALVSIAAGIAENRREKTETAVGK